MLVIFGLVIQLPAQITDFPYNEGFENAQFPPPGWVQYPLVPGDMEFIRVTDGEWPECLPHDGSEGMVKYNSFSASAGEEAVLISPELMLSSDNVVRFWFFRSEDPSNNRHDKLEVYYNSVPDLSGAVLLDSVSRAVNFYPQVPYEGWYQYAFNFNHPGSTYIIFKAVSAYGWSMYLDDTEVNTTTIDNEAPEVISLQGTQQYAHEPMNLVLTVRDNSAMPLTLDGEVVINGATQGIVMARTNGTQGDFTYEGSIAGQPDHTTGEIRFYMIDWFGNSTWSDYYPLHWDWNKPILEEGFEGEVFPPAGWTVTGEPLTWLTWDDYGLVYYTDSDEEEYEVYPPEGERQAALEWDFQGNEQNEWLITPEIPLNEAAVLTFKTFARLRSYDYDEYLVKVTTDGFIWETLWSAYDYDAGVTDYGEDIELDLGNYVGEDIRIAWHAYNLYGGNLWYSWFVDDVKIRATDTLVGVQERPGLQAARAYPNPFASATTLEFTTTTPGTVTLTIFSSNGTRVETQTFQDCQIGQHTIRINANHWAPGFYYYSLTCPDGSTGGKLILKQRQGDR